MTLQRYGPLVLLALSAMMAACREVTEPDPRPVVAVSVLPQAFFVERIAGERVRIQVMIPPGANPSTFEPSIDALKSLSGAVLYVALGHPHFAFEAAWIEKLLAEQPRLDVIRVMSESGDRNDDPHIWLSPRLVRVQAERIGAALQKVLPEDEDALQANLVDFLSEIETLDAELRTRLEPYQGRKIFVFHSAWGYFTRDYGLVQVSLEEGSKTPGAGALASFIEEAKREKARVIFVQPQFSQESARVVAQEIGAGVELLDPLARDWPSNLRRVAAAFEGALRP
ncbi:MAG TPA: zinc ABC transporter substrate-binding protein [Vicinamibacteria bacterium]|jgi:zinc transport system substrate-binding protein